MANGAQVLRWEVKRPCKIADSLSGGKDVGGEAAFKETDKSIESGGSVGGGFVFSHVSSSLSPNRAMKSTVEEASLGRVAAFEVETGGEVSSSAKAICSISLRKAIEHTETYR